MTEAIQTDRHLVIRPRFLCSLLLLASLAPAVSIAQEEESFDPITVNARLDEISEQIEAEDVTTEYLNEARSIVVGMDAEAAACRQVATEERQRLEARFEPLQDITDDVSPAVFDQRVEVRRLLDEAIDRQTRCSTVKDYTESLIAQITETQNRLSQQFLSNRSESIIVLLQQLPERVRSWPARLRNSVDLELTEGVTPAILLWALVIAGLAGAGSGIWLRHRFTEWYEAAGGDDMPDQLKYLVPKPIAEYAPLMLFGFALTAVLYLALVNDPLDLAVVRIALSFLFFGIGCVLIDWATGPMSPSARVKGLIPRHVRPLRLRLRFFIVTLVLSFVFLGTEWLAIRRLDPDVSGRTAMIFLVATSLIFVLNYLGRIPGIRGRIRLVRYAGALALIAGIFALIVGYQNFAGYLVHGVTRTLLALTALWILLWLAQVVFDYLAEGDSPGANKLRSSLGVSRRVSRTGLGFMQLVADLLVWIGFLVFLIYVWDESGTTLDRLAELVVLGGTVGDIQLVPLNIIIGILIFAGLLVFIGWVKRWIDRRWLQHIMMERGAREALITLIGYVGFILALLIGLTQAGVDLTGLAIVSGALAVGIGFGMQEIANNFVSGLILLFERPIRSGDFVTVGNVEGFVRSIRIRATEIETLDNQNVLVPNSELISGRVTNWVLRDTYGRLRVLVGVAYGSDVEKVREILEAVAQEHPEVITDGRAPGPRALFMGFGDSSLDFELRVRISRIDRRFSVQSDLNFAINQAFKEADVTIPFPQRDLHLISYPQEQPQAEVVPEEKEEDQSARSGIYVQPDSITRTHREEVELPLAINDVWKAITDIESIKEWLATDGEFAAHIGGKFSLSLRDETEMSGRIDVFLPPRRMRLVIASKDGDEPLASGPMTVEFSLVEDENKTRLSVTVSGIPATEEWQEDYRRSEDRWQNGLVELQEFLARR
ncbi:MAG: mechanosensitive ion channel [Woeseiaceae bacterium]|nr:mechanosensitive ion channel [Woeseiaceae bacterium]